jgi:hypothetical protein
MQFVGQYLTQNISSSSLQKLHVELTEKTISPLLLSLKTFMLAICGLKTLWK